MACHHFPRVRRHAARGCPWFDGQDFLNLRHRQIDKLQPKMVCNTRIIAAGVWKYSGIAEREPFACMTIPPLAGPAVQTAMDISLNTTQSSR
jgi:hypothetical protein